MKVFGTFGVFPKKNFREGNSSSPDLTSMGRGGDTSPPHPISVDDFGVSMFLPKTNPPSDNPGSATVRYTGCPLRGMSVSTTGHVVMRYTGCPLRGVCVSMTGHVVICYTGCPSRGVSVSMTGHVVVCYTGCPLRGVSVSMTGHVVIHYTGCPLRGVCVSMTGHVVICYAGWVSIMRGVCKHDWACCDALHGVCSDT